MQLFAENKFNFLASLLQQKLALVMTLPGHKSDNLNHDQKSKGYF